MLRGGEIIKACRKFRGITQRELAARSGVSETTISNVERGIHEPTYTTVICCLEACDFTLELTTKERKKK